MGHPNAAQAERRFGRPLAADLDGIRVVQLDRSVASSYCGKLLLELGADVSVALASDDEAATSFSQFLDAGKRLISVTDQEDRRTLVAGGDVIIAAWPEEHWRTALGVSTNELRAEGKVVVAITNAGLGQSQSPLMPDLLALARGGVLLLTGDERLAPTRTNTCLPQFQAALFATVGALGGILSRDLSGAGCVVDVSLVECVTAFLEREDVIYAYQGESWHRTRRHRVVHPFTILPCKDGFVALAVASPQQFIDLMYLIGAPELAEDEGLILDRVTHAERIDAKLVPWLRERNRWEIANECQERRIPVSPVLRFDEVLGDEHHRVRQVFDVLQLGSMPVSVPISPFARRTP